MQQGEYIRIEETIREYLPVRVPDSNKGTYGKVLCIAGSVNMAGAAYLCAYAAYRAGAGLVRVLTPEENRIIIQSLLPEAVLTTFDRALEAETERRKILNQALAWADVTAIGPGLGNEPWAAEFTEQALRFYEKPLVVDADGLNHLAGEPGCFLIRKHHGPLILTPHVGEFSRLSGLPISEIKKQVPALAARYGKENGCICVLKDAPTAVGDSTGQCFVNTTGNHGMSTGGSGDVLTGIVAGLLAQKTEPLKAALLGVWLHGRAGDLAAEREGTYGLMARHLIEYLPGAMMGPGKEEEQQGEKQR